MSDFALPDYVQGARFPSMLVTLHYKGTTTPVDISGDTITGFIENVGVIRAITGTLTVTDGPNGVFRWDLSAADVADAGRLWVQFVATFASGQTPAKTFVAEWKVGRALSVAV